MVPLKKRASFVFPESPFTLKQRPHGSLVLAPHVVPARYAFCVRGKCQTGAGGRYWENMDGRPSTHRRIPVHSHPGSAAHGKSLQRFSIFPTCARPTHGRGAPDLRVQSGCMKKNGTEGPHRHITAMQSERWEAWLSFSRELQVHHGKQAKPSLADNQSSELSTPQPH